MKHPLTVATATSSDNSRRYKSQYVDGIQRIEDLKNDLQTIVNMDSKLYVEKRPSEEVFTDSFYDECWPEFHSSPLIKKKGRTPLQMSIDCVEHNIGNTEMCKQICNQFGSVENLIKHANKIRYDHLFARSAWLVYDKSDEKMQFFCMPENYMPNPERFETLVAY